MSKGSNQRPKAVDDETFESNWEQVFGPKAIECDVIRVEPAADGTLSIKCGLNCVVSGFTASRDGWPSITGQPVPASLQTYADPWPFKTVEELAEAMNGQRI